MRCNLEEDVDRIYSLILESFNGDKRKALESLELMHQGAAAYPMKELSDVFLGDTIDEKVIRMRRFVVQDNPIQASNSSSESNRRIPLEIDFNTTTKKVELNLRSYLNYVGPSGAPERTMRSLDYSVSFDVEKKIATKHIFSRTYV